jgi:glucan phosphoethanolaminetransferase (alkaline phosphatase superfamily)
MNVRSMMKQPSAFLPVAMSLAALATVLGSVAIFGAVHEADEGAAAHIFQLLITAQIPVVVYFAIKSLPRAPKETFCVLALQAGAALAAMAPVFFLHL